MGESAIFGKVRFLERFLYVLLVSAVVLEFLQTGGLPRNMTDFVSWFVTIGLVLCAVLAVRALKREITLSEDIYHHIISTTLHDLRNPLASIMLACSTAVEEARAGGQSDALLNIIMQCSRMQQRIMITLADVTQIEQNVLRPSLKPENLAELLNSAVNEAKMLSFFKTDMVELSPLSSDVPPEIVVDRRLLEGIIINLLLNSFRFTPKTGRIFLRVSYRDSAFHFDVTDTGEPVPTHYLPILFSKYYGKDELRKTRTAIGLNLHFSKLAVDLHGGSIRAVNPPEGGFSVLFSVPQPQVKK